MNSSDPAGIFAAATSLWEAVHDRAKRDANLNLSESYQGIDSLMREVMRIGTLFEEWATNHVAFDALGEVWPYFVGDSFGRAVLDFLLPHALAEYGSEDCLRTAVILRLPMIVDETLPLPLNQEAENPVAASTFRILRIRSMRQHHESSECEQVGWDDDLFDPEFGPIFFSLYGIDQSGDVTHIADRPDYMGLRALAIALAPSVSFPSTLIVTPTA